MKNKTLYVIIAIVILAIGFKIGSSYTGWPTNIVTGNTIIAPQDQNNAVPEAAGDAQLVMVGMSGANYIFNPSTVQAGKQVILKSDGTVRGCGQYMVQRELGINGNIAGGIKFTPTKAGDYTITCGMNMYRGNLKVA